MKVIQGYEFDDVLLLPKACGASHRAEDIDISTVLPNGIKLEIPIIASPMKGIISKELVVGIAAHGGIGLLHRFYENYNDLTSDVRYITSNKTANWGAAVGIISDDEEDEEFERAKFFLDWGAKIICVDVANGYNPRLLRASELLKIYIVKCGYNACVMAGNVVTPEGYDDLYNGGVDIIRAGIGPGSLCTTNIKTGIGAPQLSAIDMCHRDGLRNGMLVSDGGIKESGDVVKALAAGADAVMIGSLFGQTYESAHDGIIYGSASRKLQLSYHHSTKSIEGIERVQAKTISLDDFLTEFVWNIRSGMSYKGKNIAELRENAVFITHNHKVKE